mmetsp:Transcript_21708/g.26313  ORF Transcript_21708/g.26313 Transcript_21708/m.26313 type:complete len:500 (+) Transcript_21708:154-1653(+)
MQKLATRLPEQSIMNNGNSSCSAQQLSINLAALTKLAHLTSSSPGPLTSTIGTPALIDFNNFLLPQYSWSNSHLHLNDDPRSNSPVSVFSSSSTDGSSTDSTGTGNSFALDHISTRSSLTPASGERLLQSNSPIFANEFAADSDSSGKSGLVDFSAFVQVACDTAVKEDMKKQNSKSSATINRDMIKKSDGTRKHIKSICEQDMCLNFALKGHGFCKIHTNINELKQSRQYAKKYCRVANCTRIVVRKGVCKAHGEKCSQTGCTNFASHSSAKLCISHGGGKQCKIPKCFNTARSFGLCIGHGGGRKKCSVDGCEKFSQSRGLCCAHGGGTRCSRENCQNSAQGKKGLCCSHGGGFGAKLKSDPKPRASTTKIKAHSNKSKSKSKSKRPCPKRKRGTKRIAKASNSTINSKRRKVGQFNQKIVNDENDSNANAKINIRRQEKIVWRKAPFTDNVNINIMDSNNPKHLKAVERIIRISENSQLQVQSQKGEKAKEGTHCA